MKKILRKIGALFSCLFAMLIAIFLGVCVVFLLPLDYIKYKRSLYYKKEHKKYKLFAATDIYFDLYNEILKHELPIKYVSNPDNDSLECGWFVFHDILIIPNVFSFEYDPKNGKWKYCYGDDEETKVVMSIDEYIHTEIQDANELAGKPICDKAVVLIDSGCIDNAEAAKSEPKFLLYEDNREEILNEFCNSKYTT